MTVANTSSSWPIFAATCSSPRTSPASRSMGLMLLLAALVGCSAQLPPPRGFVETGAGNANAVMELVVAYMETYLAEDLLSRPSPRGPSVECEHQAMTGMMTKHNTPYDPGYSIRPTGPSSRLTIAGVDCAVRLGTSSVPARRRQWLEDRASSGHYRPDARRLVSVPSWTRRVRLAVA
jgi:hypothetical protein